AAARSACMSIPIERKISSERGFTTCAWGARCGPSRRSTTRFGMPWRASRIEAVVPAGPAPTTRTGTSTRRTSASQQPECHDHHHREHHEDEDVLVPAEDVRVLARDGDHAAVRRLEDVGDPESAEVAALPPGREPEIADVDGTAKPDEIEVRETREEHESEEPHEVDAGVTGPLAVQEMARVRIADDRSEELERRDREQHLHHHHGSRS